MRLFKCYDSYFIDEKEQVLAVWANDEEDALKKAAKIHSKLDYYEMPYESVLSSWIAEEHFVAKDCDVYICYPKDISYHIGVRVVSIPFDVQDIESYVMDKLIEMESQEEYFIDHLKDKSVNMSFNERFYCDSMGWIFEQTPSFDGSMDVREDIKVKALEANMSIGKYIDQLWLDNVYDFFEDNEDYRDLFIEYIMTDAEPTIFDEGFFFYVCKKVMQSGEWVEYEDIRKVDVL